MKKLYPRYAKRAPKVLFPQSNSEKKNGLSDQILLLIIFVFTISTFALSPIQGKAEGTSQVSTSTINTALSILPNQNRGSYLNSADDNFVYFRIGDHTVENFYYGFHWVQYSSSTSTAVNPAIGNMYMRIYDPNDNQVGAPIQLPTSGNGYISTYNQASIGANIGGSHPGGYSPSLFNPTMNGEYHIEFYISNDGGATQGANNTGVAGAWAFSPFWDLQVATTAGARRNGRVHCSVWAFNAVNPANFRTGYDIDAAPTVTAWSNDSTVLKFDFNPGFRPIAFDVAVTEYGTQNTNNYAQDRKSRNSALSPTLPNGYLLFVNPPDSNFYPSAPAPLAPELVKPITLSCNTPINIRYRVFGAGDVRLLLDINGVPGYQTGSTDVILEDFGVSAGLNSVPWNGLDGLGNPVASGQEFTLSVSYLKGRFNVPLYDAEINKNGFNITTLAPVFNPNVRLYWDDADLTNVGTFCDATFTGAQNNITGTGLDNTAAGSVSPAHAWSGNGNTGQVIPAPAVGTNETANLQCDDYGNVRVINTYGWGASAFDTALIRVGCLTASGTVWFDKDNSANGTNSNIFTPGEVGTLADTTLYATLVDPVTGDVIESVPVNSNGTYNFTNVPAYGPNMPVTITNVQGTTGSPPPPIATLPTGWTNTSPLTQNITTDSVNLTGIDYGVDQPFATDPDFNATWVDVPVTGDVSTNDEITPPATTYGSPTPVPGNPDGSLPVINPDGTYVFESPVPGIFQFEVPVCPPGIVVPNCPIELLTITVLDAHSGTNPPVANVDIASTLPSTPVTLNTLANDKAGNANNSLDPSTVAVVDSPNNGTVTVNPTTGETTYTPNPGFVGIDTLEYTVCDDQSPAQCTNSFQIIDVLPPTLPNITVAADDYNSTPYNTPVSGNAKDNDSDPQGHNQTITPQTITIPGKGTIVLDSTGAYTFTPVDGFYGPVEYPYTTCDDGTPVACANATIHILVEPPIETDPDFNATWVDVPVTGDVSTNDENVPPGTTYGSPTPVPGNPDGSLPVINPDGTYVFESPVPGVFQFEVPVCPPGVVVPNCIIELLTITVLDANSGTNPPVANVDIASTPLNTPVTLNTLANDKAGNPNNSLVPSTVAVVDSPNNGTVTVNPTTGETTYTPNPGFVGIDTLEYTVCDDQSPAQCTNSFQIIDIQPANAPNSTVAADDYNSTPYNTPVSGNAQDNDSDPQGDNQTITPQTTTIAGKGTIVLDSNGNYTFTPENGFYGPVEYPYTTCDNGTPQACAMATIHILVEPPIETDPDFNATWVNVPVTGDVSTNDENVPVGTTYGSPTPVPGNPDGSLPTINPDGTYTFTSPVPGVFQFEVPVCPPGVVVPNCIIELLTITVLDARADSNAPVANVDIASTLPSTPVTLNTLANDKAGNPNNTLVPSTVAVVDSPNNGTVTVNPTTGETTYTPNPGFIGVDTLEYTVCDDQSPAKCTNSFQIIDVLPPNAPNSTVAADDYNSTPHNTPVNGNAKDNDSDPENDNQSITPQTTTIAGKGTIVLDSNGNYTFTPVDGFIGPVEYPYTTCDDGTPQACANATIHILVGPPMETDPDFNATWVNVPVTGDVSTNDETVPPGTTYGGPTPVPGNPDGSVPTINPDGTYTFTSPVPGVFKFEVPVCPPGVVVPNCPIELLTITVLDSSITSNPPVANVDIASTPLNTPVTLNTLSNDEPGNVGNELVPSTVTVVDSPNNGTVTVNPTTGETTYTPNPGFTGIDTLEYTVCDNQTPPQCATSIQIIDVQGPNTPNTTVAADDYKTTLHNTPVSGNAMDNDSDPQGDNQTITPQTTTIAGKGTLVLDSNGNFTFTPVNGFVGPVEYPYTTCDNGTPQACANATIHILVPGPIPMDTLVITPPCPTCPTDPMCATKDDLPTSTGITSFTICGLTDTSVGTLVLDTVTGCVVFTGSGTQGSSDTISSCVVACKNGVCDTTQIQILPPVRPDTVTVKPPCGTCPTDPICATADDLPAGGSPTSYTTCGLAPSTMGTQVLDTTTGCIVFTGNGTQGPNDTVKSCVVACKDGICDTTYINILPPVTPDTLTVTPPCGTCPTDPICATGDDLPAGPGSVSYTSCGLVPSTMGTQVLDTTTGCIVFTGNGTQGPNDTVKSCVVACKDGICDTTYINILPPVRPDTLTVTPPCGTCPTDPICATADDLPTGPGTISYTTCGLSPSTMGTQVLDTLTGCIVFTGNGTQGPNDTVKSCVVACKNGICDTTYINILPPVNPDTVTVKPPCGTCPTDPICATADDLPTGPGAISYSTCGLSPTTMGSQVLDTVTGCIVFTGNGTQGPNDTVKSCVVACKNGICDTTYINILPPVVPDTIITVPPCGTCPTTSTCPTADDLPTVGTNETYQNCGISSTDSTQGTLTVDPNGCAIWTPNGSQIDTITTCIVKCLDGLCDTTVLIIPPTTSTVPIELVDFNGRTSGGRNILYWTTATEINNKYFELYHGASLNDMIELSTVPSKAIDGNSSRELSYQFVHINPLKGDNFYRLSNVDIDGQRDVHQTINLYVKENTTLAVYPNPVTDNLHLAFSNSDLEVVFVELTDITGKVVYKDRLLPETESFETEIPMSSLTNGMYLLRVSDDNGYQYIQKVNKK